MARGKKTEKALTPKEKLAQALVPAEEQPYLMPENWCCFYFTSLIDIEGGTQPPKSQFVDTDREGYIRLVQIRDFATDKYTVYVPDNKNMRHFNTDDILIARYGASLGRICTGLCGVYNVALAKTIFSEDVLYRKYVYWMLQSESFQAPLLEISRTAQAGFNKNDLSTFKMPLPPLAEQRRIVVCIESLFAKLDEAKEKAQAVVDSFEIRKATILHKAFTGELTERWRKENGIGLNSWEVISFGDLILSGPQNGLYKPKDAYGSGTKILRIDGFYDGYVVDWETLKRLTLSDDEIKLYKLNIDEIVVNRVNSMPYLGKSALIRELPETCVFESNMMRISLNKGRVIPEFIIRYLNSPKGLSELRKNSKQAVNQASINQKDVKNVIVKLPSRDEQAEIICILNDLQNKERQAKKAAEAVLDQIDTMKKAILARAFRGELGTNDPAEESAVELLKTLL